MLFTVKLDKHSMNRILTAVILSIFLMSIFVLDANARWGMQGGGHRSSEEQLPSADDIIAKMKTQVNLTKEQYDALKPIIENNIIKRQQLMQDLKDKGITDKDIIKNTMEELGKEENQKLSQVLTKDQMDKWVSYQNYQKMLKQDQANSAQDQMGQGHRRGRHGGMGLSSGF